GDLSEQSPPLAAEPEKRPGSYLSLSNPLRFIFCMYTTDPAEFYTAPYISFSFFGSSIYIPRSASQGRSVTHLQISFTQRKCL
ncbi:hypothetical protein HETIRDRAFT_311152, partial [Heterobasidion irregulare TC 32-1]